MRERRGRHHPARACSERGGRARAGAGDGRSGRGGACLWRDLAGGLVSTSSCALDSSSRSSSLCLFAGGWLCSSHTDGYTGCIFFSPSEAATRRNSTFLAVSGRCGLCIAVLGYWIRLMPYWYRRYIHFLYSGRAASPPGTSARKEGP